MTDTVTRRFEGGRLPKSPHNLLAYLKPLAAAQTEYAAAVQGGDRERIDAAATRLLAAARPAGAAYDAAVRCVGQLSGVPVEGWY